MRDIKTIAILASGFGFDNIGDSAMLECLIHNIKQELPNCEIKIMSFPANLDKVTKRRDVNVYHSVYYWYSNRGNRYRKLFKKWPLLAICLAGIWLMMNALSCRITGSVISKCIYTKELLQHIDSCDLVIHGGGGTLNDVWIKPTYMICFLYLTCRALGKKVVISGQTVGPLSHFRDKRFVAFALNKVDTIFLRDGDSSKLFLQELGVRTPYIKSVGDDATNLPFIYNEKIRRIIRNNNNRIKIGVNVRDPRGYRINIRDMDYEGMWAKTLDKIVSEFGATIYFIPMSYGALTNDIAAAERVYEKMINKEHVIILRDTYLPGEIKGIISRLDVAIGYSYHFLVFALSLSIPVIGLFIDEYYRMKNKGLFSLYNMDDFVLQIETEEDTEKIVRCFEKLMDCRSRIKERLKLQFEEHSRSSMEPIFRIARLLN